MITVQNIFKNEQTRHNECHQLDDVEIKIDRGASLRGALRTGNWGGTGKKPREKSVSIYLLRRRYDC